jgi:hypothetical protein
MRIHLGTLEEALREIEEAVRDGHDVRYTVDGKD